ncbi:MAG: hypothetical protein ACT4OO_07110 [Nitrospiraceae bacterium]
MGQLSLGHLASVPHVSEWVIVVSVPLIFSLSCATSVPKPGAYYTYQHQLPETHMGLPVNLDLLATAKLPQDEKRDAEKLLIFFHTCQVSLTEYIESLERNLEANERLSKKYGVADSIIGGLSGLASTAVLVAAAAIAAPIAGAIWVAVGLSIQQFDIEPRVKEARHRLEEARALAQTFPDIERAFDAVVFVDSETEALKRFKKWETYIETLQVRASHVFARPPAENLVRLVEE